MNCVFTMPNNRSQVEPNLAFAGGPPTPSDRRFCSESEMKRALEQSLAKERPVSPYHIALSLGFTGEAIPRRKFPDLCHAIIEKIAAQKTMRIAEMERILTAALNEDPPPTLEEVCQRVACCRPFVLRRWFASLCDQLLERRRAFRVRQIETLKKDLQRLSTASPPVSLEQACKLVGFSRQRLVMLCPEESAAVVARYKQTRCEFTQRRTQELECSIRDIVKKLYEEGQYPSVRRVKTLLGKCPLHRINISCVIKAAKRDLNAAPSASE